jgi:hypothetical protein
MEEEGNRGGDIIVGVDVGTGLGFCGGERYEAMLREYRSVTSGGGEPGWVYCGAWFEETASGEGCHGVTDVGAGMGAGALGMYPICGE